MINKPDNNQNQQIIKTLRIKSEDNIKIKHQ
jgi:hypothetical protein